MTVPLRYPDLTPAMLGALRLDAALSETYGDTRSSKLLAGHAAWKSRNSNRVHPGTTPARSGGVR